MNEDEAATPDDPATEDDVASEEVRRLLADARASEPMPADVQARLDDVLGQLSAERANPVVDLMSRRRRRAKTLLIAAAAVTVVGLGLPRVLQNGFSTSASDDSAASSETAADSGGDSLDGGTDADSGGALEEAPESASEPANADSAPARIRPGNFPADVEAARDRAARNDLSGSTPLDPKCLAGTELTADLIQELQSIPVRYGGLDAALVLSKARNGSQEATLYVCGESAPRRTILLTAR